MTPVRLEPAALRSRVKHSTTEPLRSLKKQIYGRITTDKLIFVSDKNINISISSFFEEKKMINENNSWIPFRNLFAQNIFLVNLLINK